MPGSMRRSGKILSLCFGGITTFTRAPAHGTSQATGEIVHDDMVVFEVMTDPTAHGGKPTGAGLSRASPFSQDEIVIRAMAITRL